MKYKPEIYAKALVESLSEKKGKEETILKNFLKTIKKNGDRAGISKITLAVENYLIKKRGGRIVLVESARPLPENAADKFLKSFRKDDKIEFINNRAIIAGARVTIDGERELDFSFRCKLNKLFI